MTLWNKVIGWALGGFLVLLGLVLIIGAAPIGGLLFGVTGLLFLPPARTYVYSKIGRTLPSNSRTLAAVVGVVVALIVVGIEGQGDAAKIAQEAEQKRLALEEEARQAKANDFLANREYFITEGKRHLAAGELSKAVATLSPYRHVKDAELQSLLSGADAKLKERREATQEQSLQARLKDLPASSVVARRDVLGELVKLRPTNGDYKKDHQKYVALAEEEAKRASAAAAQRKRIEKQFSAWDGSHPGLERLVKRSMNDPDSYEHDETRFVDKGDHIIVFMKFRGRNGFGGMVRNEVVASVDFNGNVLEVISQN